MKTIRSGVFETNSSSTHSVTIMSEADYEKWRNDLVLYNFNTEEFQTQEDFYKEVSNEIGYEGYIPSEEDIQDYLADNQTEYPQAYEDFFNDAYLETDATKHSTESGDKIVIICKYGRD